MTRRALLELIAYGAAAVLLAAVALSPAPAAATSDVTPTPRGAQLFALKGCVGCHTHADVVGARMQVGPDLTDLATRATTRVSGLSADAYVRQSLRAPAVFIVAGYTTVEMPDLHLSDAEIDALTSFLLQPD